MLPGMQKPYYLSYTLGRTHQFEVVGALGGVTNFYESPWSAVGGVQMFLGDYDHNNDINYEVMVSWWNDVVKDSGVRLYIGQNINDLDIASEIYKQIEINREYEYVSGNILFSASDIMNDNDNIVMQLKEAYNCKAILPTKFNDN